MGKITEERILEILAPMYEVMPRVEKSGVVALFKEGVKFAMIKGEAVHLVDKYAPEKQKGNRRQKCKT